MRAARRIRRRACFVCESQKRDEKRIELEEGGEVIFGDEFMALYVLTKE